MNRSTWVGLAVMIVAQTIWTGLALAAGAPVHGAWLPPSFVLEGVAGAPEAARRARVAGVIDALARHGVNTIFLETFLRGYAIAPFPDAAGRSLPLHPRCHVPAGEKDLVTLVIEEASRRRMAVHAWIHAFYFRSDAVQGGDAARGPSIYGDLVSAELAAAARKTTNETDRKLLEEAARIAGEDLDLDALRNQLAASGHADVAAPMASLYRLAARAGAPGKLFLRDPRGDVHRPHPEDANLSMWVDPASHEVRARLLDVIRRISHGAPGLAGIHLDHIRYPDGPVGLPAGHEALATGQALPGGSHGAAATLWRRERARREEAIRSFVASARAQLARGQVLSAAVHPMYYFEREEWPTRIADEEFVAQDWYHWDVDLVLPMVYRSGLSRIRRMMAHWHEELARESPGSRIRIVPGTDDLALTSGVSSLREWSLFSERPLAAPAALRPAEPPARLEEARPTGAPDWTDLIPVPATPPPPAAPEPPAPPAPSAAPAAPPPVPGESGPTPLGPWNGSTRPLPVRPL